MADNYLRIIPLDPLCVPSALARDRALGVLQQAVPRLSAAHGVERISAGGGQR
jgi:hypothetical protein